MTTTEKITPAQHVARLRRCAADLNGIADDMHPDDRDDVRGMAQRLQRLDDKIHGVIEAAV